MQQGGGGGGTKRNCSSCIPSLHVAAWRVYHVVGWGLNNVTWGKIEVPRVRAGPELENKVWQWQSFLNRCSHGCLQKLGGKDKGNCGR